LIESEFPPMILVVVSNHNLDGLCDLMEYILERDLRFTISFYRDHDATRGPEDLQFEEQKMIDTMRSAFQVIERRLPQRCLLNALLDKSHGETPGNYTCGVGQNYLVIDQKGGVAKCQANIEETLTTIDHDDPLGVIRA